MKPTVGLTGGIASGKSTVARFFEDLGVPVVDADQLAREVVAAGSDGLQEIVDEFGDDVLLPEGTLDRKKLGEIVFNDEAARRKLEGITHPRIAQAGMAAIAGLQEGAHGYVLYEAALLVENGAYEVFPALVVVAVTPDVQLERLIGRDEIDEQAARARVASQLPLEQKVAVADFVIHNDGGQEATRQSVGEVHAALLDKLLGEESR